MPASITGLFARDDNGQFQPVSVEYIIKTALAILDEKIMRKGQILDPVDACAYFSLRLGALEHEVFAIIFLDSQNRIIEYAELFRGTLSQTSVYPREIVKMALRTNAGGVMLAHGHPSGVAEPSHADEMLTKTLVSALALIDVRVHDHIIVGGGTAMSFALRGLL